MSYNQLSKRRGSVRREELANFCRDSYPELVGLLSFYCSDRYVAEELAQEALARACRDWSKLHRMDYPDRWLRRVAINLANSNFRRWRAEARAKARLELSPVPQAETDVAEALTVRQAVSRLPSRQRAVVVLHYFCDLTLADVAVTLDLPLGTVKSLAHRASKRLRTQLQDGEVKEVGYVVGS